MSDVIDKMPVRCMRIHAPRLDPVVVVWINEELGKGRVIVQCYDQAWTAYWGAMGNCTLEQFFLACDVDYLTGRFGPKRKDESYLERIVTAIREALKSQQVPE
ncbi:hypothetical protein SAMN02800692_2028 [Luteibacter sp. UNC138MFCol5.1]|uniref:hypothetical protein n=1 Tax=Luteibacter sp. UNC138MFCol5.1 TaxID=1502774 RepID=UPI0008D260A1|nr:hypothetical protein [Luteibacter sp. UNC138MFCol5.1]SEO76936.1 hypothetical protein SAMN02800692_2028 [Luteibacter sp. UNC138MFCol5.1]